MPVVDADKCTMLNGIRICANNLAESPCLELIVYVERYMSRLTGITIRGKWSAGLILRVKNIAR